MKKDILLVDKPVGWTSFDVVAKIRNTLRAVQASNNKQQTNNSQSSNINHQKPKKLKVGHAGTLDPFATGLLIILVGDECKKAGDFLKLDKTYEFTAKLGEVSTTGDPEGDIKVVSGTIPTEKQVREALNQFQGTITQVPPAFSAIKVNGKRAYDLAREGKEVDIPEREVTIYTLELQEYSYPFLKCVCDVSSGTYIRTLVEDIGNVLTTGAYCTELRRTKIDSFDIKDAHSIETALKSLI